MNGGAILIGIGANLPHPRHGVPTATCRAALQELEGCGVRIVACSPFYESEPVPPSSQPLYANAVARIETGFDPERLLDLLHEVEASFGRVRHERNEARVLDLDLLAYGNRVSGPGERPLLPHPRMHERGFVLVPLRDVVPGFRHPVSGATVDAMIAALPPQGAMRRIS